MNNGWPIDTNDVREKPRYESSNDGEDDDDDDDDDYVCVCEIGFWSACRLRCISLVCVCFRVKRQSGL